MDNIDSAFKDSLATIINGPNNASFERSYNRPVDAAPHRTSALPRLIYLCIAGGIAFFMIRQLLTRRSRASHPVMLPINEENPYEEEYINDPLFQPFD